MSETRLALAIQKPTGSTNLGDETAKLLEAGGLTFRLPSRRDTGPSNLSGVDIWLARNADISRLVSLGVSGKGAGLGIVGRDKFTEFTNGSEDRPTPLLLKDDLGYSFCTLKLGVQEELPYQEPKDLEGMTVATSYPKGTQKFFEGAGVSVRILECEGGAESLVFSGAAQACVEISDTGNSMLINGIRPVADVMKSEAVLIADPRLQESPELEGASYRTIVALMTGIYATQLRMMKLNFRNEDEASIMKVLPSRESPTVQPLKEEGWSAAESLVPLSRYDEVKRDLLIMGAKDIFRQPIQDPGPNTDDQEVTRMMKVVYGADWQYRHELLTN